MAASSKNRKIIITAAVCSLAFITLASVVMAQRGPAATPANSAPVNKTPVVPEVISRKVSFPVYYPRQSKLPNGYTLDLKSFGSPAKDTIVYAVNDGQGQKLVFSLQAKPAENELKVFYKNNIPLHNEVETPTGTAAVGSINGQTLVSLPTADGVWILVTAPEQMDNKHLKQVLEALAKN